MYVTIPSDTFEHNAIAVYPTVGATRPLRQLRPGCTLFREGDKATRIYQVVSGVLRLTRVTENGRRQVIAFGYPDDIIGFPKGDEYQSDCDALSSAVLIPFSLDALVSEDGDCALRNRLLEAALREISAMQDHFMMLGRKSADEKVASFLCVLAKRVGNATGDAIEVELPMSRSDIADFLGLTTETISRTLTQLRKIGVIGLRNIHTVIVQDLEALLALAEGDET